MAFVPISVKELLREWLGWHSTKNANDGTYSYVGKAVPGSATSSAVWQIKRIKDTTDDKDWADGNFVYDNIWDNRTSLSYS